MRWDTVNLLEENIGRPLSDINHTKIFFVSQKKMEIKTKINKWDLLKLKILCTAKETINKTKDTSRLGENICKWCDQQRISLQNIQTAHEAQYHQNKQPNPKMGRRSKQTFLQRCTDGQKAHDERCSTSLITNYKRNANQNYSEISPHSSQNGYHQKIHKQ